MVHVSSFCPNSDFPQLCDKVTVGWDEKRGRFIKAKEDVPIGVIVCVEQGYTVNVDPSYCYRCLTRTNDGEYAYCNDCEEFYEPDELAQGQFDDLGIFKLAAHLVFSFPFVKIVELLQSEDPVPPTSAPESLSTSEITSVYQLNPFPEIGEAFKERKIQQAIKEIVVSLETDENWKQLNYNARRMTFTKALRIMAERCAKNAHTVYSIHQKESEEKIPMGTGLFPIASIFNHSCKPNVSAFFVENTFVFVSHGVKAGEELVDSYGVTYNQHTLQERTEFLSSVSGFKCYCDSCVERKSLEVNLEKSFNNAKECAMTADSLIDIDDYIKFMTPKTKDFENLIIAFSLRTDSEVYSEKMFKLWKDFVQNAKERGIEFDPWLIRPYIEMTLMVWNDEVECSKDEKSSILTITHRLLKVFYAGYHPFSDLVNDLIDDVQKQNVSKTRKTVERFKLRVRSMWKLVEPACSEYYS